MNRFTQLIAVLTLSVVVGLQWTALQSVGWASMLIQRSQTTGWTEAVRTTFDGEHPCEVCRWVAEGRKGEKESAAVLQIKKLESGALIAADFVPAAPPVARVPAAQQTVPAPRRLAPPLPPPRAC